MSHPHPAYFAHVDGLRALAVLAVLAYHLHPQALPGGFTGVDVFFVISGYVVTASLAGHRDERPGAFLARFYARRLGRLVPALVAMLVVTTALYVLFVPKAWFNRAAETTGQAAFWGLSNWVLDRQVVNYFEPRAEFNPFTHTWSLGVEEQFYLLAPLLLFAALARGANAQGRRVAPAAATAVIAVLAVASLAAGLYFGLTRGSRFVFYAVWFRFWELAAGVLLYLVGSRITALSPRVERLHRYAGPVGLGLVALAFLAPQPTAHPYLRSAVAVTGTVLLIGLPSVRRAGTIDSMLSHPVALWVGLRSYALYLWHWPVYVLARWTTGLTVWPFNLIAVALSFALAAVSYRALENPIRHSRRLRRWPPGLRIGAFVVLLAAGWWAGRSLLQAQPALGLGQPTRQAADWYGTHGLLRQTLSARRVCEPAVSRSAVGASPQAMTTYAPQACAVRAPATLFVVGDSHATAYQPMLEQLSAEQARVVRVLQVPGCAYLDMTAPMTPERDAHCHRMARTSMQAVLALARPHDVVFLPSLRLPRLVELGGSPRAMHGDGAYLRSASDTARTRAAAADAWTWITPFLDAGLHVVFELPKPVFRAHAFQCLDWFNRDNPDCRFGLDERRDDQERYRAPVVDALRGLAAAHPRIHLWDPLPHLCESAACSALRDGRPLFFDADHVSPYGNLVLLPALRALITALPSSQGDAAR
ncbi:MAG: acyltransferase family protein [Gammaproteobacteria bacterium]